MSNVQFGSVVGLRRFRVKYQGTDTLRPGMALCFNYDTTTNYLGADKNHGTTTLEAESIESSTTADGYQNEGKFMLTEKPAAGNIRFIAGLVAGPMAPKTGPCHIDVYDLNDSGVVEVWSGSNITAGDAMFITAASYKIGNTGDVFIGYAMETVNRSGTDGKVLVYANRNATPQVDAVTKTADFTLAANDHGKVFDNTGDADALTVTLPTASNVKGLRATFVVCAAKDIALSPQAGDKIVIGNDTGACSDGGDLTLTPADANDVGMNVTILSDGDNWIVPFAWAPAAAKFVVA